MQLGVAAPFVALLLYLLKQANDERREMTARFLDALKTTVDKETEARLRAANELATLTQSIRVQQERSTAEHERIVDALGKMTVRERAA